jgi:hypothetical protein
VAIRRGVCTEYARHHVAELKARPALVGGHPTGVAGNPPSSPMGQRGLVFIDAAVALPLPHPGGERVGNFAELDRSKLERLTELQSRTIEGLGMVLATPAPPETKVEEAGALVRHFQELKDTLLGAGTGGRDASK